MATTSVEATRHQKNSWREPILSALGWSAVVVVLAILALANPANGDEDLFVAPAALAADARIYTDFLFLHMPLQAELTRVFADLVPGYGFIALRIAMAIMGAALLGLVYAAQRGLGVERRPAIICTGLLACSYSFQFSSGVVRNDIMAALLSTAGTAVALVALQGRSHAAPAWGVSGLLFSSAAAVRISAAFPAAGAGLFLISELARRRIPAVSLAAFVVGGCIGLTPCLHAWLTAPQAFIYSVLTYPSAGNLYWYVTTGRQAILDPAANVVITLAVLAVGPGLGALLTLARLWMRREWTGAQTQPHILFLNTLIVTGLIGALLPTPINFQEAMTFLPQLFIRLGLEFPRLIVSKNGIERFAVKLMSFGAVIGCGYGLFVVAPRAGKSWPAITVTRQAHWIGERLRAAGVSGFISTFAARVVLDSGYVLDPRFTSGVFLYRAAPLLSADQLNRLHGIGAQNLRQSLDQEPPAAIVIGRSTMDKDLRDYAVSHYYEHVTSPSGLYDLYIRILH